MKIRHLAMSGFRGVPGPFQLDLDSKSLCLVGPNGMGKSSLVDAIEFWSSGNVERFNRSGAGLDSVVHLYSDEAVVECRIGGGATHRRRLVRRSASALELASPAKDSWLPDEPVPILRHQTMSRFMDATPGARQKAVLALLGLDQLLDFRSVLVTARNSARRDAVSANTSVEACQERIQLQTGDQEVLAWAQERAKGLQVNVGTSIEEFLAADLKSGSFASDPTERLQRGLARSQEELDEGSAADWNRAVVLEGAQQAAEMHRFLDASARVLAGWAHQDCPLCEQSIDIDDLKTSVSDRALEVDSTNHAVVSARARLNTHLDALKRLAAAIADAQAVHSASIAHLEADIETAITEVEAALAAGGPIREPNRIDPSSAVAECLEGLVQLLGAPRRDVIQQLNDLQSAIADLTRQEAIAAEARDAEQLIAGLFTESETRIREVIEGELARLGACVADYFGRLTLNPVYSDVRMIYADGKSAGIEFELVYDGKEVVSPPHRVVSESQLNALGLAFFLAHHACAPGSWRVLVLDDVVNSFDADYRMALSKLLADEFADWQILFFTHDSWFAELNRLALSDWRTKEIVGWSPTGGPILAEKNLVARLRDRLDGGDSGSDLGGLARQALEADLAAILDGLQVDVPFSRRGLYTASTYVNSLERGLDKRWPDSDAKKAVKRLRAGAFVTNLGSHDKPGAPPSSPADLRQLVDDLTRLNESLICGNCHKPVWKFRGSSGALTCGCGNGLEIPA